ncbi:MAG: BMP family ABC transporter substrate-binding protein [Lachnospiraceae bacterium]|nr:BMP family ABC transporter substrate-binding protein [Lachnospiraceae bacterium]
MKKKLVATLMAAAMVLTACSGGGTTPAPAASTAASEAASEAADAASTEAAAPAEASTEAAPAEGGDADMKVAMVTDYGDITDQSFNQTTYEASKAFCDANGLEFNYFKPAGDADAERVAMIDAAVAEGYNVLVLPGFAFANAIYETAPMYPDVKFVALDISEGDLTNYGEREFDADNVFSAVYQEELSGYMAGYAAVKLGYTKLGFLGGMAVPAVIRYGYGFVEGADDAAAELGAEVTIEYAYGNQFFGDADITAAMDTWYGAGTEVVFAAGGSIYSSACEAAQKTDGKVIGVDVDQAPIIDGQYGEGMTITSAMKGLGATVNTLLSAIYQGNWSEYSGKILNLGIVDGANPENNYVQLPLKSTVWNDNFTEDDYKAIVAGMADGTIKVSNETPDEPTAETVKLNFQGNIK